MITDELLFQVASEYHIVKKNQEEIANGLGVSRVQVSKYLKMAEQRGLIRIQVVPPHVAEGEHARYRALFKKAFGLKHLLLSPTYGNPEMILSTLSRGTEDFVLKSFGSKPLNVGVGWGHTTFAFVKALSPHDRPRWRILPLSGGSTRASEKYYNLNYLVQEMAEKLNAQFQLLYLPFFSDTHAPLRHRIADVEYENIRLLWDNLDVVITSVGADIDRAPIFEYSIISRKYIDKLSEGVVGGLLAHFYNEDGKTIELGIEDRMINVSLRQLRKAKCRIVIAYGTEKVRAILGALNAKLVDVLATDENTAVRLLNLVTERHQAQPKKR